MLCYVMQYNAMLVFTICLYGYFSVYALLRCYQFCIFVWFIICIQYFNIFQYFVFYKYKMAFRGNFIVLIFAAQVILTACQFPKVLWTYWENGSQNDLIGAMFDRNHRSMLKQGWEIKMITKYNIKEYLKAIPSYSEEEYQQLNRKLTPAAKSDYVRCMFLSHYGGVYVDHTSIFLEDFSWLEFDNLRKNPHVRNRYDKDPQVLLFTYPFYGTDQTYYDKTSDNKHQVLPGYEIWFIAVVPNSIFLSQYCPTLIKGYLNGVTTKEGEKKYIASIVEEQKYEMGFLKGNAYLASLQLLQIQIQKMQRFLDKQMQANNSTRILASWHYKIWHISSLQGPFAIYYSVWSYQTQILAIYDLKSVEAIFKLNPLRYFLKMTAQHRKNLQSYCMNKIRILDLPKYLNPNNYKIVKGSILHKYLIFNSSFEDNFWLEQRTQTTYVRNQISIFQNIILPILLVVFIFLGAILSIILVIRIIKQKKKKDQNKFQLQKSNNQLQEIESS